MSYANRGQGAVFGRSLSAFTSKYRAVLLAVLLGLIALGTVAASASYLQLQSKLRELSALEPVKLLAVAHEIQAGDVIREDSLVPMFLYRHEYELRRESYVLESEKQDLIGRVVKVPLLARSFVRREYLAELGSLPGLVNLIDKNHSLLDLDVPQQGFNVFIRPDDKVDLYEVKDSHSEVIVKQAKVILVDSEPLGKAPLRVVIDPRLQRHLTVAIPDVLFERALRAKQSHNLVATYRREGELLKTFEPIINSRYVASKPARQITDLFQPLVFIRGNDKEVLSR